MKVNSLLLSSKKFIYHNVKLTVRDIDEINIYHNVKLTHK